MKKIFNLMIAFAIALTITSCKHDVYNETIKKDVAEMTAKYGEDLIFYESHAVLNKTIEEAKSYKGLDVAECENIFQVRDTCYTITHDFVKGTTEVTAVDDYWLGSCELNPDEFNLTITDALKVYFENDQYKTTGNKITLRAPVGPVQMNPMYIIGQHNSPMFVSVDAITGKVGTLR